MKKRILSLALALVMLCGVLVLYTSLDVTAATELSAAPNPIIEYGYSADTPARTIRYIAQNTGSLYFNWDYWPTYSFGGYTGGPEIECGTACISMALSYVGVNRTPKALLEATNGYTSGMWVQQDDAVSKAISISQAGISAAMNDYITGEGKYSPICIYIVPFSATSDRHWVLLVGKTGENEYLALNPWHTAGTNGTFLIKINGTTASYNGITNPISSVNQWYNPNVKPPIAKTVYPANCAIKVSSSTTYIKSLPCSEKTDANSTNIEVAKKGDQYQAIGLVENTAGNLWYKVTAKNGSVGYMYAGDTIYLAQSINDIKGAEITAPTNHTAGAAYVLTGSIISTFNQLTEVSAYVYTGNSEQGAVETGAAAAVNGNAYTLGGSAIDKQTEFNKLPVGIHTYVVWASYKNHYAKSATSLGTNTGTIGIYKATFNVVNGIASCSHSYNSTVTTEATCVSNGIRTFTCSKCGASYTETINATGSHNYVGKVTANAYCGGDGTMTYTCSGCSSSYTETIPATGEHTWGDWCVSKEVTCTDSGIKMRKCPVCYQEETEVIPATGHVYGSWKTVTEADCTTSGTKTKTCVSCGDVQTQTVSAIGHSYNSETIPANCTEAEKTRYTCENCGDTYEKYTGEEYLEWSTEKPAGVDENLIESKNQYRRRSITYTTEYSSWGAWSDWQDGAVTATELTEVETRTLYPYYYFYCKICGDGVRWYNYGGRCGNCGTVMEYSSGTVVWLETSWDLATPYCPFGTDTGKYAIVYNGDTYWKWTDGSPKTQYRYRTRTTQQVTNYGLWSAWADDVYTQSSAWDVENRVVYRYVSLQLGDHIWDNGTLTTKPGCTTNGEKTFTCDICGATRTEAVSATGQHDWGQWRALEEPTCEQSGTSIRQCTNCSAKDVMFTSPLGHALEEVPGYAATCTTTGLTDGIACRNCGEVAVSQKVIPVIDHIYTQGVCSACGKGEYPVAGYINGNYTGYAELETAVVASNWVKLYENATVTLSLTKDLYIDLNGFDLSGTVTTNGYKIYGMDSTTDGYTCTRVGYMKLVNENGKQVAPVNHFKSDITGQNKRYMAIKGETGYSFHRFYLGITHMSLKPTTTAVGYKGMFYGDEMVAANLSSFGFTLQLQGNDSVTVAMDGNKFVSGKAFTLRIDNFDVERYAETELLACATLQMADGTVIESATAAVTLRSLVERLNTAASTLTAQQLAAIKAMIEKYVIIKSWNTENLY